MNTRDLSKIDQECTQLGDTILLHAKNTKNEKFYQSITTTLATLTRLRKEKIQSSLNTNLKKRKFTSNINEAQDLDKKCFETGEKILMFAQTTQPDYFELMQKNLSSLSALRKQKIQKLIENNNNTGVVLETTSSSTTTPQKHPVRS